MSWILLEGLDRSGKSTVAEYYRRQGHEVVHMSAPNKRYHKPGYSGPSYLEEIVEMYSVYAGKDVVFDRTPYGELIWPEVFNRLPLLNEEDYEYLAQLEYNQGAVKYMMFDEDTEAHWKRCMDNKEPINRIQFVQATRLYDKLELERDFEKKQLGDFAALAKESEQLKKASKKTPTDEKASPETFKFGLTGSKTMSMEDRLDKANAIKTLLSTKIVKKKDSVYEELEQDIRAFLQTELAALFTTKSEQAFTDDEVKILKIYAQRIKAKME